MRFYRFFVPVVAGLILTIFFDWRLVFLTLFSVIVLISFTVSFKDRVFSNQSNNSKEQTKILNNKL